MTQLVENLMMAIKWPKLPTQELYHIHCHFITWSAWLTDVQQQDDHKPITHCPNLGCINAIMIWSSTSWGVCIWLPVLLSCFFVYLMTLCQLPSTHSINFCSPTPCQDNFCLELDLLSVPWGKWAFIDLGCKTPIIDSQDFL